MKVRVLGAWGAYPEGDGATTGLLVEEGDTRILIDCGSGVLSKLFKSYHIRDLSAVIITHHHHDHTADLGVFSYALLLARMTKERTHRLPMYMLQGPPDRMKDFNKEPLADLHILMEKTTLNIGGIDVRFARTTHPVPCLAVRLESGGRSFVVSADTSYSDAVINLARGADVFLCESSMYKGMENEAKKVGHVTATQAGLMAQTAGVKRLLLTHFPHYGDLNRLVEEARETFTGEVERVHSDMVVEI